MVLAGVKAFLQNECPFVLETSLHVRLMLSALMGLMMKIVAVLVAFSVAASGQALSQEAVERDTPERPLDPPATLPQPSAVSKEDVQKAAGTMFETYVHGGPGAMLKAEEKCLSSMKESGGPTDDGVARCSLMGMSGAFIEASYARQQRRSPAPTYTGQGIRERIMSRTKGMGWGQERTQTVLVSSVSSRQGEVITGLMNAGMR